MIGEDPGRFEMKYAVPCSLRPRLLDLAMPHVRPDSHARALPGIPDGMGYAVHSMYFDTARLDDYFDRLGERKVRDRIRVRTYGRPGQGQLVFLENKRKLDARVIKQRVPVCSAEDWAATITSTPWRPWVARLRGGARFSGQHFDRLASLRRPVTVIHYRREVYVGRTRPDQRVRFTLDHEITVSADPEVHDLYATPDHRVIPDGWIVLELKYADDAPAWMRRLVRELRLIAEPVSKFGLGVAHAWRADRPREVRYLTPRSLRQELRP